MPFSSILNRVLFNLFYLKKKPKKDPKLFGLKYIQTFNIIGLANKYLLHMRNDSQIFFKRDDMPKILGGIRYVSSSIPPKKQPARFEKPFRLNRSIFKNKAIYVQGDLIFGAQKFDKTTEYSLNISPNNKNQRTARYKLCNSKNVCVFSNLKKVETQEEMFQNLDLKFSPNFKHTDLQKTKRNSILNQSYSPRLKRTKQPQQIQATTCSFKMRKVSSSQSCRQKDKAKQKVFDGWRNQDHSQDPDIIFYK